MGSPGCDRETQLLAAARKIDALMQAFETEFDEYFDQGKLDEAREALKSALEPFDDAGR